jgi:hypothetical protein
MTGTISEVAFLPLTRPLIADVPWRSAGDPVLNSIQIVSKVREALKERYELH